MGAATMNSSQAQRVEQDADGYEVMPEDSSYSSQTSEPVEAVELSPEQEDILHRVQSGENVFFTGSAGTGKSLLLREIVRWLECRKITTSTYRLAITASTGLASMNIGGSTIYSWASIGLGAEELGELLRPIVGERRFLRIIGKSVDPNGDYDPPRKAALERWENCMVLILDEISMIDGILFNKLEALARCIRRNNKPFGGIQLIVSGDFLQLPPVAKGSNKPIFAFQAESWNRCLGRPLFLRTVFRQKQRTFIRYLNEMRLGRVSEEAAQFFKALSRPIEYPDGIEPTELFPVREQVGEVNNLRLAQIPAEPCTFIAKDSPGWDERRRPISPDKLPDLLERMATPRELVVKEGAQVMLLRNLVQNMLVNGSVGKVMGYSTASGIMWNRKPYGCHVYVGVPLDLCPLTGREFGKGRAYDAAVAELGKWLNDPREWPIVRFYKGLSRDQTVDILCVPQNFVLVNHTGIPSAFREQVPLILAYALTIHKSQGQTLERVRVDLARTFTDGQAYVALSRATSVEGLQVLNFSLAKVTVHQDVVKWLKQFDLPSDEVDELLEFWHEIAF